MITEKMKIPNLEEKSIRKLSPKILKVKKITVFEDIFNFIFKIYILELLFVRKKIFVIFIKIFKKFL